MRAYQIVRLATPTVLDVIVHQWLQCRHWLQSSHIRRHFTDLCWLKLQAYHQRFVHMVACQSGHTSNRSKQNNSMEHLDNQSWACMQMWNIHMQPYNWILVLMYAHRSSHGSCMDVYVHIWVPIRSCRVCSLINYNAVTTSHLSLLSIKSVSSDSNHLCCNLLGDHSSF